MPVDASETLLCWYAVDKQPLPWRPDPGDRVDPYRIWLSEIMLQQTSVAHARPFFHRFVERWPDVAALAQAEEGDILAAWAGLGYYARARNLVACARRVAFELGGAFPDTEAGLRSLPGIGRYTAAAIAAIAFGRRAVAVDANVERIVARLFAVDEPLPAARREIDRLAERLAPERQIGDFTQAMMQLGQTICLPRRPRCTVCPVRAHCAAAETPDPAAFPRKAPKKTRPRRTGVAYWLEQDGRVFLVRRPASGLLGGMLALPTDGEGPPAPADWEDAGSVRHVFTHFELDMRLLAAEAAPDDPQAGLWWPLDRIEEAGLPTLFARLAERGRSWRLAA